MTMALHIDGRNYADSLSQIVINFGKTWLFVLICKMKQYYRLAVWWVTCNYWL